MFKKKIKMSFNPDNVQDLRKANGNQICLSEFCLLSPLRQGVSV